MVQVLKKVIITGSIIFIFTMGFLEVLLRIPFSEASKDIIYIEKYYRTLLHRVNPIWFQKEQSQPLLPPFDVFANLRHDESSRLDEIRSKTRLLRNTAVDGYDFLRHESTFSSTRFTAYFNNLGFRRQSDTLIEKSKKSRRIIVYGSYQAFGFALPESLTYAEKLEARLNQNTKGIKYEVLNSAQMAGTAIVGYAHFLQDVKVLKPDLVIFDYGMVDAFIINDNMMPQVFHFDTKWKQFLSVPAQVVNYLIGHSTVFYKFWTFATNLKMRHNMISYFKLVDAFFAAAEKNKVPVVSVQQIQAITPAQIMNKVASRYQNIRFVDSNQVFSEKYDRFKNRTRPENFWLNEAAPDERVHIERHGLASFSNLRMNLWQINEDGQDILAEYLEPIVRGHLE